jgi:hypothetical protein
LTDQNDANAVKNANDAQIHMSQRARIIVEKIGALEQKYSPQGCKKKPN